MQMLIPLLPIIVLCFCLQKEKGRDQTIHVIQAPVRTEQSPRTEQEHKDVNKVTQRLQTTLAKGGQ